MMTEDVGMRRLGVWRCAATGAVTAALLFIVCWIGAATVQLRLSHMFIELFTALPIASEGALAEGLCWSLLFGALTGLVVALSYNLFGFLDRR